MRQQKNPLEKLLSGTSASAKIPSVAKEGIVSLLISIVANEATSNIGIFSAGSLLRLLLMFLVTLGIIHYSLRILEQNKRNHAKLEDLREANSRKMLNSLSSARTILDRIIQNSGEVTELRTLRTRLTSTIFEAQNPNMEKFNKRPATIEEFNSSEQLVVECAEKLVEELELQLTGEVNINAIARLVDAAGEAVHSRITLTKDLKDLYIESIKEEEYERKKIPKEASSELKLYLNTLRAKYASNRPEILHTGDYLPDARWEYRAGDKNVIAKLSHGFGTPLLIEARWQDSGVIECVQKEAEGTKKNQYKCLCLVNTSWERESRDFAVSYFHPQLSLYLYGLKEGLFYNKENSAASHYEFWFNNEQKYETLEERAEKFIETNEFFIAHDMASSLGLKADGAEKLLDRLENIGAITDVSFKSDTERKYTKSKKEEH